MGAYVPCLTSATSKTKRMFRAQKCLVNVRSICRVRLLFKKGPPLRATTRLAYTSTPSWSVSTRRPPSCSVADLIFGKSIAFVTLVEFAFYSVRPVSFPLVGRRLPVARIRHPRRQNVPRDTATHLGLRLSARIDEPPVDPSRSIRHGPNTVKGFTQ